MRTVEEFIAIVEEENQKHNEELLNMSPEMLINRAWDIAKWHRIYGYITERIIPSLGYGEKKFEDFLALEIDAPIKAIYEYERNYMEPQWTLWTNLGCVVRDMIKEAKNQNK